MTHRALARDGGLVQVVRLPTPFPVRGGVLVRLRWAGVCGTDLQILRGVRDDPAAVLGHEGMGEIAATGGRLAHLSVGDRVVFNPTHPGDPTRMLGHTIPGVFQEYVALSASDVEAGLVVRLEQRLPDLLGVLVEPLAAVLYGLELLHQATRPAHVTLIGGGSVAALYRLALRLRGRARVSILHPRRERLRLLLELGLADVDGVATLDEADLARVRAAAGDAGVGAVVLCTPREAALVALQTALRVLRPGGVIDLFGGFAAGVRVPELPGVDPAGVRSLNVAGQPMEGRLVPVRDAGGRELLLLGHRGAGASHLHIASALLAEQGELFRPLITHVLSLEDAARALNAHVTQGVRTHAGKEWIKMAINMRAGTAPDTP